MPLHSSFIVAPDASGLLSTHIYSIFYDIMVQEWIIKGFAFNFVNKISR
jgi:hypothetical protein